MVPFYLICTKKNFADKSIRWLIIIKSFWYWIYQERHLKIKYPLLHCYWRVIHKTYPLLCKRWGFHFIFTESAVRGVYNFENKLFIICVYNKKSVLESSYASRETWKGKEYIFCPVAQKAWIFVFPFGFSSRRG